MINKFYKFHKYEHKVLIKAIEFYIDVFRSDKKSIEDLEVLEKIKKDLEKNIWEVIRNDQKKLYLLDLLLLWKRLTNQRWSNKINE